jgi:hypothetical protein
MIVILAGMTASVVSISGVQMWGGGDNGDRP